MYIYIRFDAWVWIGVIAGPISFLLHGFLRLLIRCTYNLNYVLLRRGRGGKPRSTS
jgi:hypothetical protein